MTDYAEGLAYLTLRKVKHYRKLQAVKVTTKPPTVVDGDCVVVKINLRVPLEAFRPLEASEVVQVSIDQLQKTIEAIPHE